MEKVLSRTTLDAKSVEPAGSGWTCNDHELLFEFFNAVLTRMENIDEQLGLINRTLEHRL